METPLTHADVQEAAERIRGHVHQTPVLTCRTLDAMVGASLFFKCENLQKVGAFKARGATNSVLARRPHAVATHSSGNHGAAVAYAAGLVDIPAYVVMPRGAPAVKRAAVAGYGAEVIPCDNTLAAREATVAQVRERTGAELVHPYDERWVIAGQGTVGLELAAQVPDLDAVIAPIGGGGLTAGLTLALPGVQVIGAEPETMDDAARSLAAGARVDVPTGQTMADGLRTLIGALPFAILKAAEISVRTVSEQAIADAMRLVWERMKLLIEPSSAAALAAALQGDLQGRRVAIVLTGGNVDLDALPF